MSTTRGIRNKNPGNIERGKDQWQGMAEDQSGDARFIVFTEPEWGIRAIAKLLLAYQTKHGLDTVAKIINRWAPPVENATGAYIDGVARMLGVATTQRIDVHEYRVMAVLVRAIIKHENGIQPYTDAVINEGLRRAGIVVPAAPSDAAPGENRGAEAPRPAPGPAPISPARAAPWWAALLAAILRALRGGR